MRSFIFRLAALAVGGPGPAVVLAAGLLAGCSGPGPLAPAGSAAPSPSRSLPAPAVTARPTSGFVPESFTAVSPSRWWVLGSVPCGSRECPGILATADGGATFRRLPAPGGPFGPGWRSPPAAGGIRFADPRDGWVFGPALYATHDGGRHWTRIALPGQVTGLEPGLGVVFAIVSPPTPRCATAGTCTGSTPAPQLWRASPSGDRWNADPAAGAVSTGLATRGRSVWVIDSMSTRDGPAIGTHLLHSADGGSGFAPEPGVIPGIACSYSPASDTVVWSYCSGGHFMYAYRSADAGAHFTAAGPGETVRATPNGYPNGSSLEAASATTAVAADGSPGGPLIRTIDAGRTWRVVQAPPDGSGTWSLIGFTTPEDGYALRTHDGATYRTTTASLWHTTNGGKTWAPVENLR